MNWHGLGWLIGVGAGLSQFGNDLVDGGFHLLAFLHVFKGQLATLHLVRADYQREGYHFFVGVFQLLVYLFLVGVYFRRYTCCAEVGEYAESVLQGGIIEMTD